MAQDSHSTPPPLGARRPADAPTRSRVPACGGGPRAGDTIVDLGMVRGVAIEGTDVTVEVALTIAACPLRNQIEKDVVSHVPGARLGQLGPGRGGRDGRRGTGCRHGPGPLESA